MMIGRYRNGPITTTLPSFAINAEAREHSVLDFGDFVTAKR
jgi:hypothetical protein